MTSKCINMYRSTIPKDALDAKGPHLVAIARS